MPTTVLGLILFATTISPGLFFLRAADKRRPSRTRTPFRETAEWFVVGSTATLASLVTFSGVLALTKAISIESLLFETRTYAREHILGLAIAGLGVYIGACLVADGMARLWHRNGKVQLSEPTAWCKVFREDLKDTDENAVIVRTKSGETFSGWLLHYTPDFVPVSEREIVISRTRPYADFPADFGPDAQGMTQLILSGSEILSIELLYVERTA